MREALVFPGTGKAPREGRPVVFAFHGHNSTMNWAAEEIAAHKYWPEAIVVYPQGLKTIGITDPEGKESGWQRDPGSYGDRDLKFVDTVLASLKGIDRRRIYAMGHSNGARFTYLLWATRGDVFAAYGICATVATGLESKLRPASAFVVAGRADTVVPFADQEASISAVRLLVAPNRLRMKEGIATETGKKGLELGTYLHPGGHVYPPEGAKAMIEMFKRRRR